ncbi:MAG: hypothetical protein KatS3mg038_1659 [Candidatus Kapaibacterium sp.]|nr:MAG: hypothetical protein KatS3mg038_1659 [Candidatus Kapabacteria bacterium]
MSRRRLRWRRHKSAPTARKAALLAALGDAEEGAAEGGIRVTYYSQTRKEYVVPASSYRVLRIKKPKEK